MNPHLIVVGAGGQARVVIALARRSGVWSLAGVLDRSPSALAELIDGVPIVGTFDDAAKFFADGIRNVVFAIGDNDERASLHSRIASIGFDSPTLRHPSALIEENSTIGAGCVISLGAIIGAGVRLGDGVIVNTGAIIDHETVVGDHAHIAPGCCVAGRVRIGKGAMIGIGTCVIDKISIGDRAIIGSGSVVVEDIPGNVVAYGNPARVVRHRVP